MARTATLATLALGVALVFSLGCAQPPVIPESSPPLDISGGGTDSSDRQCLGYYAILIKRDGLSVNVVPLRSGQWHFNVVSVLNGTMGVSAAFVPGESDPVNGLFVLNISLEHPFPERPRLTGFDVKGILMTPGSLVINTPDLGDLVFADTDETRLENADGYTRWWNPGEFTMPGLFGYTKGYLGAAATNLLTATVNPYKLFADILGPNDSLDLVSGEPLDSSNGRAAFESGATNTRKYTIRFPLNPAPQVVFGYAVDAAWAAPTVDPPVNVPGDFPINANQQEAYRADVTATVNTLYYDDEIGAGGGVLRLQIEVYDWQGQAAHSIHDQIDGIRVFSPDLMGTESVEAAFADDSGSKAYYLADLTNKAFPMKAGRALIAVVIESNDGSTYKQATQPAPEFGVSAFQTIVVDVPDPDCMADADNDFSQAQYLPLGGAKKIGQVCNPDDQSDFYYFIILGGYEPAGSVTLWCTSKPDFSTAPNIALYGPDHSLLGIAVISDGQATVSFSGHDNMPGNYYVKVTTPCADQVVPYFLESKVGQTNVTPAHPVEITPDNLFVRSRYIHRHDQYAFLLGDGCWVYDLTDPSSPVQLFHELSWLTLSSCFHYPYCYFVPFYSPDNTFYMIDFTDPTSPVMHENVISTIDDPAHSACMDAAYLYVGTHGTAGELVKVYEYASNPQHPTWVTDITMPKAPMSLAVMNPGGPDSVLAVGTYDPPNNEIRAYDIAALPAVNYIGAYPIVCNGILSLTTWNYYIFAGIGYGSGDYKLGAYYVEPEMPGIIEASVLDMPGYVSCLLTRFPFVYVADGLSGVSVVDISVPYMPEYIGSTSIPGGAYRLDADEQTMCAAPGGGGMYVLDISNPAYPDAISHLRVVNSPNEGVFKDDYLLVSSANQAETSFKTLDISTPSQAFVAAERFPYPMSRLYLDDDMLAGVFQGMSQLYDVSDPTQPSLFSALYHIAVTDTAVAIRNDALYLATKVPRIEVYDISNPHFPAQLPSLTPSKFGVAFAFYGTTMYMATEIGLEIYSVSDPLNPVYEGAYATPSSAVEMVVRDDIMYLLRMDGLEILDLSDPVLPAHLSWVAIANPITLTSLAVESSFAYVGGVDINPVAISIWPPDSPAYYGVIYDDLLTAGSFDILVRDGYLYEMNSYRGVRIFDLY